MTDKEKIKTKIEQLMYAFNLEADIASCEDAETEKLANIKYQVCKKILEYIDSMQEEPVSEKLEEAAEVDFICRCENHIFGMNFHKPDMISAFKAGAKWQKEQMMAEAIDVEVKADAGGYPYIDRCIELYDYDKDIPLAKEGDKVKIVVIKGE